MPKLLVCKFCAIKTRNLLSNLYFLVVDEITMVRVAHPKPVLVSKIVDQIITELVKAVNDFRDETNKDSKFSTSYVGGRDNSAKTHADNAIKFLRWLYETELGLTAPAAYTEAELDALDRNLRTFEDGTNP